MNLLHEYNIYRRVNYIYVKKLLRTAPCQTNWMSDVTREVHKRCRSARIFALQHVLSGAAEEGEAGSQGEEQEGREDGSELNGRALRLTPADGAAPPSLQAVHDATSSHLEDSENSSKTKLNNEKLILPLSSVSHMSCSSTETVTKNPGHWKSTTVS